jgi:enoyl-CoA hydratase
VCAVNGHAIAGGMVLALCGDHRVAGPAGGFSSARELVLRGELWDARDARERGMLDEVVEQDAVLDRSLEVAGELAALPARTYAYVKAQLRAPVLAEARRVLDGGPDPLVGTWVGDETGGAAAAVLRRAGD